MTHNDEKNQSFEINAEVIPVIELVDRDIKTIIFMVFHIFRKLGEILNMFNRDMEDILKHPKLTFRDESYKI